MTTQELTVESGQLRHRALLQEPVLRANGEQTGQWDLVSRPWIKLEELSGRESLLADQVVARKTHLVTMRHMPGVQTDWRLVIGKRVFHVVAVNDVMSRNVRLELICVEDVQAVLEDVRGQPTRGN